MLIVVAAALLGIWRYRSAEYFKWVGILFAWMLAAAILFWGGGTLQNPAGDGIITHQIRVATSDGVGMGIYAIVFLAAYWGGAIFFITRMIRAARRAKLEEEAAYDDPNWLEQRDGTDRQMIETLILLALAATWVWYFFWLPMQSRSYSRSDDSYATTAAEAPLTVEQQLEGAAADVNASTPKRMGNMVLQGASASGRTLTYHYTTDETATAKDVEEFVRTQVLPKVCDGPMRGGMKQLGISYEYAYRPKNLNKEVGVVVTERMCERAEN